MKIAAAEAQWTTCQPCSFSLFQIGGGNKDQTPTQIIAIPHLLSLLATNHWNGKVIGLSPLQSQYASKYGPGYYVPNVFIQYWSMRVMAYLAVMVLAGRRCGGCGCSRRKLATSRRFLWVATWAAALPFLMNTAGWLLTESGRQPWVVQGIMLTKNGVSPSVSTTEIAISLGIFVALYITLGVVDFLLMLRYSRKELAPEPPRRPARSSPGPGGSVLGRERHDPLLVHPITILWMGFFVLEGFDFGVGILHGVVGRDEAESRAAINTIGPLWDGNEVWLVVAAAAIFAAFPAWYATMFSGFTWPW